MTTAAWTAEAPEAAAIQLAKAPALAAATAPPGGKGYINTELQIYSNINLCTVEKHE